MIKKFQPSERKEWAARLHLNEQYLYQCLTGRREMKSTTAKRIEDQSNGVITRKMLCQKTWPDIWPELNDSFRSNKPRAKKETKKSLLTTMTEAVGA